MESAGDLGLGREGCEEAVGMAGEMLCAAALLILTGASPLSSQTWEGLEVPSEFAF